MLELWKLVQTEMVGASDSSASDKRGDEKYANYNNVSHYI